MSKKEKPLTMHPVRGLRGATTVPGDKSLSHRALIFGALSESEVRIQNLSGGEDVQSTRRCLEMMGAVVRQEGNLIVVRGRGAGFPREPKDVLDAGNSGTTLRLLTGLLSAQPFFSVLTGDASLRSRPMNRVVLPLRQMGARIAGREQGRFAPLAIAGGDLRPIAYESPVASAQVKTAILLAGLGLPGETRITEPYLSRDHTERLLEHMGGAISRHDNTVCLGGGRPLSADELYVSGDPSSAAFFLVAALITNDSDLEIRDVCVNATRIGYLNVLRRMGADIELGATRIVSGEPVADLRVRSSRLRATEITPREIPACIDEIPILCVAAAFAEGTTRISGARELRVKESDRIAAMVKNLKRMGIPVREEPDGMIIEGRGVVSGFQGESMGDHRIAMSLVVAALAAEAPSQISDSACMRISFPGFLETLEPLMIFVDKTPKGSKRVVVAIDGPSGTGKSTIARLLAERLNARHIDTGAMYRAVGLMARRNNVDVEDPRKIVELLRDFRIDYQRVGGELKVLLAGEDVTEALRMPGVGEDASLLSRFPEIREVLVQKQRQLAREGSAVMEGRDIGTVVLPDADLKVFLDADEKERARRRYLEWKAKGIEVSEEKLQEEIRTRDERDSTRETAPLMIAKDAVRVDTTNKCIEDVLNEILGLLKG